MSRTPPKKQSVYLHRTLRYAEKDTVAEIRIEGAASAFQGWLRRGDEALVELRHANPEQLYEMLFYAALTRCGVPSEICDAQVKHPSEIQREARQNLFEELFPEADDFCVYDAGEERWLRPDTKGLTLVPADASFSGPDAVVLEGRAKGRAGGLAEAEELLWSAAVRLETVSSAEAERTHLYRFAEDIKRLRLRTNGDPG